MYELASSSFESVRPLFEGFDYSLSIQAALEGNNPGRIFVDDVEHPRTALALTVEGYLLAGESDDTDTNDALRRLFQERIFTGELSVNGDWSVSLAVYPAGWEARLPALIPTHEIEKIARYHYLCRALRFNWRQHVPEGYTVQRVDHALLDDRTITFPDALRDWLDFAQVWWSVDNFLARGISYAVLRDREAVAWCTPDCVAGDRMDVGVITHPAHRRKGLASLAVAATVEQALSQGIRAVGWHCNADNVASWKTAERVGFQRNRTYAYYYYMCDPIDHLAELGWYHYQRGDYARTVRYYEQVFARRDNNPDYYYHLNASAWALLGSREKALAFLQAAVEHGWTNLDWTAQQGEFRILHGAPEWKALLARRDQDRATQGR
ncbi:MAG: GNAT family N-acetyltransferase [Anaerolineae bacterium]|nr:GNAT family N-acetyltransferase [Anaerolineae bacterium]